MRALSRIFRRRRADEPASVDAEITAFGEELARHSLVPERHGADVELLADYERALDAYEQAKRQFAGRDAEEAVRTLEAGRHALACVDARLAGLPPPSRRPLCFFDPRHGPATAQVEWAPPEGAPRTIDVCAADAVRLAEGMPPIDTGRRASPPAGRRRSAGSAKPPPPREPAARTPKSRRPRAAKETGPLASWPRGLGREHRAEGVGDTAVELRKPDPLGPSLLVVRFHHAGANRVDLVEDEMARALLRSPSPGRVVVPLPADGHEHVRLVIEAGGKWSAWLQAADTAPVLEGRFRSRGAFVFRHPGGPASITMVHKGRGAFSVSRLTDGFERGARVLSGMGSSTTGGELAGPTFLHVQAGGEWAITLTGEDPAAGR